MTFEEAITLYARNLSTSRKESGDLNYDKIYAPEQIAHAIKTNFDVVEGDFFEKDGNKEKFINLMEKCAPGAILTAEELWQTLSGQGDADNYQDVCGSLVGAVEEYIDSHGGEYPSF